MLTPLLPTPIACLRDKGGCDQGIHNYMVHYLGPRGKLKFKHHVRKNWESPVQTGGVCKQAVQLS